MAAQSQHNDVEASLQSEQSIESRLLKLINQPIEASQRLDELIWMRELVLVPQKAAPSSQDLNTTFHELLLQATSRLSDWALALHLYVNAQSIDKRKELEQIRLWAQMGHFESANQAVLRHLLRVPLDETYHRLRHDFSRFFAQYPYATQDLTDGEIHITPLMPHHLDAFAWQYADPSIQKLCNLPDFESNEHWLKWLYNDQFDPEKTVFAVIHNYWGLIGSVSLTVHEGIGMFYYWIGSDFQGYGLGTRAVQCLLALGQKYHRMECCYAKVYEENTPSHRALAKLGFTELPFVMTGPEGIEVLYYLGPLQSTDRLLSQAATMFCDDACYELLPCSSQIFIT
ncbi:GNAT family N-acetyltransferase [Algicola sagamiensis]|uniref:GNAT family N-acetyltransferase n=1 Tax=Algicola sagamiensis TaxID=163869 RepID=UPI000377A0CA|nr:GNAT family N-acetyltransferase [Algicola sagamiensis]